MLKFSVCIDALLKEYDFADRIKRSKELGFSAVEFWYWKDKDTDLIAKASREYGVPIAGMCTDTKREKPEGYHGPLYMEDTEEFCRIAKDSADLAKRWESALLSCRPATKGSIFPVTFSTQTSS